MKFGGTPLHWSSSREVIDSLIANNCEINALNFDKRTALHVMVILNNKCTNIITVVIFLLPIQSFDFCLRF